jgi:DNA repair protein RecO (recombination protein O)
MVDKTTGIVLHQLKYSDSGNIVNIYTKKFGRLSLMTRSSAGKKRGRQNVRLQPMTILEMVIYYKESRSVQSLKEYSVLYAPADIYNNVVKTGMAIFLGEVMNAVLREESPQEELYEYIRNSIFYLDGSKEGYSNFHIAFLAGLCSYLGIEPARKKNEENIIFDMQNGAFVPLPPSHGIYLDREASGILSEFFSSSWENVNAIELTGAKRNEVLLSLLRYYSVHLPSLKKINSIEILREVFR